MTSNIKKVYNRFTDSLSKRGILPISLAVQNVIFSLVVLMIMNVIITNGKTNGDIDYNFVKTFYNVVAVILLVIVCIHVPIYLSRSINTLKNNNSIEYLLSSNIRIKDIMYATLYRGLANVAILVVSAFPIACVSLYFGGVSYITIIRFSTCLIFYIILQSTLSLFLSTIIKEPNVSLLLGYICCFIVMVITIIILRHVINDNTYLLAYAVISMIFSVIFMFLAKNSSFSTK